MTLAMVRALLAAGMAASVANAADPPVPRESIEWTDAWMPHLKEHDLPRVLLIGDSITRAMSVA